MKVVGITGSGPGAGKTTFARHLAHEVVARGVLDYEILAFADPIKNMVRSLMRDMGYTDEMIESAFDHKDSVVLPRLGAVTPRHLMQTLGTEWGRHSVSPSIWRDVMKSRLEALEESGCKLAIVDDVRFTNEVQLLHQWSCVIYYIHGHPYGTADEHASEGNISMSSCDRAVRNWEEDLTTQFPVRSFDLAAYKYAEEVFG